MNTIVQGGKILMAASFLCASLAYGQAAQAPAPAKTVVPVVGTQTLGVTVVQMEAVVAGWSIKNDMLRKPVYNEAKDRIGTISDIIISPNPDEKLPSASFAIIGVGGFLGIARHDVAIPMEQLRMRDDKLILPGATKEALKVLPDFKYKK